MLDVGIRTGVVVYYASTGRVRFIEYPRGDPGFDTSLGSKNGTRCQA
jgi:hypothetical protein